MHRRQFLLPTQPRQCWLRRRLTHFSVCRDRLHSFHPQTISIHDEQAITFSQPPTEIDFPESRFATSSPSTDGISCPLIHTKTIGEKFADRSPGTLTYDWSISADGKKCYFYEHYANSEAVMIHTKTFGEKFAERLLGMIEIESFEIFGNPNENVKDSLSPLREKFNSSIGGFSR